MHDVECHYNEVIKPPSFIITFLLKQTHTQILEKQYVFILFFRDDLYFSTRCFLIGANFPYFRTFPKRQLYSIKINKSV